jgi:hypothetical protein
MSLWDDIKSDIMFSLIDDGIQVYLMSDLPEKLMVIVAIIWWLQKSEKTISR